MQNHDTNSTVQKSLPNNKDTTLISDTPEKLCVCLWLNCNFASLTEKDTFEHAISTHSTKGKQDCLWVYNELKSPCNTSIRHKGHFKEHLTTHFTLAFKPILCTNCEKMFRNRNDLWIHKKSCYSDSNFRNSSKKLKLVKKKHNLNLDKGEKVIVQENDVIPSHPNRSSVLETHIDTTTIANRNCENQKSNDLDNSESYNSKFYDMENCTINHQFAQSTCNLSNIKSKASSLTDVSSSSSSSNNKDVVTHSCSSAIIPVVKQPSVSFGIGANVLLAWRCYKQISAGLNVTIPQDFVNLVTSTLSRDGIEARLPSNILHCVRKLWFQKPLSEQQLNFMLSVANNAVANHLSPPFSEMLSLRLNQQVETLKICGDLLEESKSIYPMYNHNCPYRLLLICIAKVVKVLNYDYLSNEVSISMYEPSPLSNMYRDPVDCSGAAILLHYNFLYHSEAHNKIAKDFLKNYSDILQHHIKLVLKTLEFGKRFKRNCCFDLICNGDVHFNWDVFDLNVAKSDIFLWLRLGTDEEYVLNPINFQEFRLAEFNYYEKF
ncbi:hypothetical protein HDU92_007066 [Lobulomyces angularis]|nr:hypothetical protein HDU92_007066 [Lobulomyces angularis]